MNTDLLRNVEVLKAVHELERKILTSVRLVQPDEVQDERLHRRPGRRFTILIVPILRRVQKEKDNTKKRDDIARLPAIERKVNGTGYSL